jgi:HK97 family phage major capsid protein|tara:strand:- start:8911 stop:10317 length:1407 start_codon:yes stop_codon:yes gene_type:complete
MPKSKSELQQEMAAARTGAEAINAVADKDNEGVLSDEQADEVDKYVADYEAAKGSLAKLEANEQRRLKVQAMQEDVLVRRTKPGIESHEAEIPVEDEDADLVPARVRRSDPKMRGFDSPGDFLTSIINSETRGITDKRLDPLRSSITSDNPDATFKAAVGSDEQSTFSDPYGGFLVPEGMSPELLSTAFEGDPLAGRTMPLPMDTPVVNINARVDKTHTNSVSGGLRVYRRAEGDTSSSSRQEFEKIKLEATGLFGVSFITEELLMDSPRSFAAMLEAGFRDEFAAVILNERLNGTGVGEFLGINNAGCLISVSKETGQAATTIVYENVIKMRARVWGYNRAVWLANHDCIPQLMLMNQSVGTGGIPVWQPSGREDHPDVLLGRPIFFSEFPNTIGTAGDLICGNWSQFLEGTYQPLGSAESIHVRFVNHERTFKFFMRNAGSPWWRAALTPKNGSTLSPFVRLATRA